MWTRNRTRYSRRYGRDWGHALYDKEGEIIVFIINGDVEDFLGWHKYRKRKWRGWHLALVQYANEK